MANMNEDQLWEQPERAARTVVCRVAKFANMSAYGIEEKVLEKAEAIFLKMVGLSSPVQTSVPVATTKATTRLVMLSLNIEKTVERLAPKITLDQLKNVFPLSLRHELEATLQPLAPERTLPQ